MAVSNIVDGLEGCSFDDGDDEDIFVAKCSESDTKFDNTVGHLEDIIMGEKFQSLQVNFLDAHYMEFDISEENKFSYSDIHRTYTQVIEQFLEHELSRLMPGFTMNEFLDEIVSRKDEILGEIFEILLTFTDFIAFKEMMMDYKEAKEGRQSVDLSTSITVTPLSVDLLGAEWDPTSQNVGACGDQTPGRGTAFQRSDNSCSESDLDLCVVGKAVRPKQDGSN